MTPEEPLQPPQGPFSEDMIREALYRARLFTERWELNAKVAQALGWEEVGEFATLPQGVTCISLPYWAGRPPGREHHEQVPDYARNGWGEIVEQEGYALTKHGPLWVAYPAPHPDHIVPDVEVIRLTPGEAVCALFVQLKGPK